MGRAWPQNKVIYGSWDGAWVGTGIAPHPAHPATHYPGYTSPYRAVPPGMVQRCSGQSGQRNMVVGLILVDQLSLYARFSGFIGITEVYNVARAGIPNDHKYIPGTK